MAKAITAIYENDLGEPVTGLTPTVTIWNITNPDSPTYLLSGQSMTEIGEGAYIYNFLAYSGTLSYLFKCDGGTEMDGLERYLWSTNEIDPMTIADQVWSEARIEHTTSGTFGHGYSTTEGWSTSAR